MKLTVRNATLKRNVANKLTLFYYRTEDSEADIILQTDGGCLVNDKEKFNKSPCAAGFYVYNAHLNHFLRNKCYGFYFIDKTNNEVEYIAVIEALKYIVEYGKKFSGLIIEIYSDSQLIVNQSMGVWKVNDSNLYSYCDNVKKLIKEIKSYGSKISLIWMPRECNIADDICNKVMRTRNNINGDLLSKCVLGDK